MEQVLNTIYSYLVTYGLKIVAALVIFVVGRWVAKFLSKSVKKGMIKANVDETLAGFTKICVTSRCLHLLSLPR